MQFSEQGYAQAFVRGSARQLQRAMPRCAFTAVDPTSGSRKARAAPSPTPPVRLDSVALAQKNCEIHPRTVKPRSGSCEQKLLRCGIPNRDEVFPKGGSIMSLNLYPVKDFTIRVSEEKSVFVVSGEKGNAGGVKMPAFACSRPGLGTRFS